MMSLRSAVVSVVDEVRRNRLARDGAGQSPRQAKWRATGERIRDGALICGLHVVRQRRRRVGETRLSQNLAGTIEAEADADLGTRSRLLHGRRYPAGVERSKQLADRVQWAGGG